MAHGPIRLRLLATSALAGVTMLATASPVLANPIGGQVSAGQATISNLGQTVTIQQSSSKAVLNWASFNIAPGELTQFQQPSSSAIALNRINDVNPSTIQGSLTANGGVILINPNGVVFGSGAQVNVASLIATTANISDSTFMNSAKPVFNQPGNPNAQIINQGTITAAQAGLVGLVAPNVENSGIITAKLGKVQLASGDGFTLDLAGDGITQVGVSNAVLHQLVNNGGAIATDGGTVQLTAAAARNALDSLIVNTGVIRANSIRQQDGTIILSADTPGSVIINSGTITAQGRHKHQPGGSVSLAASTIQQNGSINVSGASGGKVSMRGSTITQSGVIYANGRSGPGGTITIHASNLYSDTANTLLTVASNTGTGGSITIAGGLSPEASAKGDDNASVYASGAYISDGGTMGGGIEILSGNEVLLLGAYLSSRGPLGGGTISVGGDYVGTTGRRRAQYTQVDQNTLILADATNNGNGGQITISGTNILFAGQASAQGGPNGGGGGSITLFAPGSNAVAGNIAADKTGQSSSTVLDYGLLNAAGYGTGGTGGYVSVLGDNVGIMSGAFIDASGDAGGGYVKIGGDFHGQGTTPTALNTYVDPNAWIFANAVTSGNGGNVAVWSDGSTFFSGNIVAEGGANAGNGGFVETSGHGYLDADGYVDLTAPNGTKGTYLLDPATIEIFGDVTPAFDATDGSISLSSVLQLWLDASNQGSITLSYNDLSTTASGSMGANTITVGNASSLVVGERIQIGTSTQQLASVDDTSNVYTITAINGTTVTLDANLASSPSSTELYGGYVKQMNDVSGNGNNATQTTAANMPLWVSNGQNGMGVAQFNVSSDLNVAYTNSALETVIAVAMSSNPTLGYQRIIYGNNNSGNVDYSAGNGVAGSTLYSGAALTAAFSTASFSVLTAIYNGAGSQILDNSVLQATGNPGNGAASTVLTIGALNSNNQGLIGNIAELPIYNTNLSTNARNLVEQYESAKWGIALTGPGNATGESGLTGAEAQAAMASTQLGATTDGYSVFADTYLERLSATSNIILAASGNVTIDLQGDNMSLSSGKSIAITSTGGNITFNSPGTITTNNAGITLTPGSGDSIILNSSSAVTLASQGGAIDLAGTVSLGSALTVNSGGGTVIFASTVDGPGALSVNAGSGGSSTFTGEVGSNTGLGALSVTAGGGITLNAVTATSVDLDSSSGSGNIASNNSGLITATSGGITINSGGDIDFSNIGQVTTNQSVSDTSAGNAYLNAINTGTGSLTVNANNVYLYGGGLASPTSLVAYYNFNEGSGTTAIDDSGNGNTGTINGATYSTSVPSAISTDSNSLSFNGTSNYVDAGNNPSTNITGNLTLSAWINWNGNTSWFDTFLVKRGPNGTNYQMYLTLGSGVLSYYNGGTEYKSSFVPTVGVWTYVAETISGTTLNIYANGTNVYTTTISAAPAPTTGAPLRIGNNLEDGGEYFGGNIDDVRVYNTALSAQDVANLYAGIPQWSVGTANITATNNITTDIMGTTLTAGAGHNVTMTAGGSIINSSPGTISASQSAGSGGNITLKAGTDIVLPSLTMNTGGGNIILDSDTANGGGAIALTSDTISTSGGNISFGGDEATPGNIVAGTGYAVGDAANPQGILLNAATLSSGAGNIVMNGTGYSVGNTEGILSSGTIQTTTGSVQMIGTATYGGIDGGNIQTTSGAITLTGNGSYGLSTAGYNITSTGTGTGVGAITLNGNGGGTGVALTGAVSSADANIIINGTSATSADNTMAAYNAGTIQSTGNGNITISGTGNTVDTTPRIYLGVSLSGGLVSVNNGNIAITGTSGSTGIGTNFDGYSLAATDHIASTGAGTITLTGTSTGTGKGISFAALDTFTVGGASASGNIIFNADTINLLSANTVQTTGNVAYKPYTASTSVGVAGGTGILQITSGAGSILAGTTAGSVTIGRTDGTGNVTVGAETLGANTTIQSGSGTIEFSGAQTGGAHSLTADTTSGNIQLDSGATITSTASGNAIILAASGGNFVNNSGSSSPLVDGSGHWLVYSTVSSSDTNGASVMNPTQTVSSQTYVSDPPSNFSGQNSWIYSNSTTNEGTVSITAASHSDTYGTSESTIGVLGTTYSCSGAGCADIAGAAALGFTGSAGTSPSGYYNAGAWTITPSQGSIAWDNGYTGSFSFTTGTLTVTPKPLTISGFAVANRAYDGSVDATITADGSLTGGGNTSSDGKYITGDSVSLVSTGTTATFGSKNVGSEIATASGYTLSGNQAADYTLTLPTAVATIENPLPPSVELQISYTGMAQDMPGTNSGQLAALPNSLEVATLDLSLPPEILTPLSGSDDRDDDRRIGQPACSPTNSTSFTTSHHASCGELW